MVKIGALITSQVLNSQQLKRLDGTALSKFADFPAKLECRLLRAAQPLADLWLWARLRRLCPIGIHQYRVENHQVYGEAGAEGF